MNLTKIILENFKAHRHLELPLRKYTILIGPNSTGKSSILQAILITKRSLSTQQYHGLITKTDSIDLGDFSDIITLGDTQNVLSIHIIGTKLIEHGISESGKISAGFGYKFSFDNEGEKEVYLGTTIDDYEITFRAERNKDVKANFRNKFDQQTSLKIENPHSQNLHPRMNAIGQNKEEVSRFNKLFNNGDFTRKLFNDFHYVPFSRTAIKYGEILSRVEDDFLSVEPQHITRFLFSNLSKNPKLLDSVSELMNQLTGKNIRARNLDLPATGADQGVTLDFVKKGFTNAITNEGTGPNQAILLLTVLAGTSEGSVIAIDEPEIHLHPAAQTRLGKIMMKVGKDNSKQIIFATHSEHMIYPFLASIGSEDKNSLNPNDVAIYYCGTDEKTGLAKVEHLPINEHGQIKGGLKGFWEADLEVLSEYVGEPDE